MFRYKRRVLEKCSTINNEFNCDLKMLRLDDNLTGLAGSFQILGPATEGTLIYHRRSSTITRHV